MVGQFCKSILQLEIQRSKPLANLTMGLASQTTAKSVAGISLSPCYHYQYSSINKAVDALFSEAKTEKQGLETAAERLNTEKKIVHQSRTLSKAIREILADEHGQ
jgi:hypothetical protein